MSEMLFAYTPPVDRPPYVNITQEDDGQISISVRGVMGRKATTEDGVEYIIQDYARIDVPKDIAMYMVSELFNKLFAPPMRWKDWKSYDG